MIDSLKTCIFIFKLKGTTYIICTYQKKKNKKNNNSYYIL